MVIRPKRITKKFRVSVESPYDHRESSTSQPLLEPACYVSKACKLIGCSRQQFYEIRRNYQTYGAEGLSDKLPGVGVIPPVAPEIYPFDYPTRPTMARWWVAQELALQGINPSVRAVCVACGNGTTCSPSIDRFCALRKPTGSRPLSSMTSRSAC